MLENMGAVIAVNDMLFQSHAGALRFFPVWDASALGVYGHVGCTGLHGNYSHVQTLWELDCWGRLC